MSFGIGITTDVGKLDIVEGMTKAIIRNLSTGVPEAVGSFMNQVKDVAASRTHVQKGTLAANWKVIRQFNRFSLFNDTPYAQKEFSRGGSKIRGRPPMGPHNIIPPILDMINENIEQIVEKALLNGLPR